MLPIATPINTGVRGDITATLNKQIDFVSHGYEFILNKTNGLDSDSGYFARLTLKNSKGETLFSSSSINYGGDNITVRGLSELENALLMKHGDGSCELVRYNVDPEGNPMGRAAAVEEVTDIIEEVTEENIKEEE